MSDELEFKEQKRRLSTQNGARERKETEEEVKTGQNMQDLTVVGTGGPNFLVFKKKKGNTQFLEKKQWILRNSTNPDLEFSYSLIFYCIALVYFYVINIQFSKCWGKIHIFLKCSTL